MGDPNCGADCSSVQDQLRNVQQIYATGSAFATILADGFVVTWGNPDDGGNCSEVQDQLRNVQQIEGCMHFEAESPMTHPRASNFGQGCSQCYIKYVGVVVMNMALTTSLWPRMFSVRCS